MRKPTAPKTTPRIQLGKYGHQLLDRACGAMQARNHDSARPLCEELWLYLPSALRNRTSFEELFFGIETAMLDETPGGACCGRRHFCACCALDEIVLAAGFDCDAHGCAHEHRVRRRNDDSLFVNYQLPKKAGSDSGLSSRSVSPDLGARRASPRAAASPYARPTAPRHARPGPVDKLADSLADMSPFAGRNVDREMAQLVDSLAGYTIEDKPAPQPVFAFAFGVGAASYAPPALPAFALPPYPRSAAGAYY